MTHIPILLWMLCSTAFSAEYRRVELPDGRELLAEIIDFSESGMLLRVPQGNILVPPNQPALFSPLSEAEYNAQPSWKVVILPFSSSSAERSSEARAAHLLARRVLEDINGVHPMTPEEIPSRGRESDRRALAMCGTELQCATRLGDALRVDVVVMGEISSDDDLHLSAVFVRSPAARRKVSIHLEGSIIDHRGEVYDAQYEVLFLVPPKNSVVSPPVVAVAPPPPRADPAPAPPTPTRQPPSRQPTPRKPPSDVTLRRMAWAPIPGLPSLAQKDYPRLGITVGIASVGTAAGVALAGQASYSTGQFVAVSVLSSYAVTVAANHIFSLKK